MPGARRASSRFATFEHAIRSTSVTAPIIVRITSLTSSGSIHWLSDRVTVPQFSF